MRVLLSENYVGALILRGVFFNFNRLDPVQSFGAITDKLSDARKSDYVKTNSEFYARTLNGVEFQPAL